MLFQNTSDWKDLIKSWRNETWPFFFRHFCLPLAVISLPSDSCFFMPMNFILFDQALDEWNAILFFETGEASGIDSELVQLLDLRLSRKQKGCSREKYSHNQHELKSNYIFQFLQLTSTSSVRNLTVWEFKDKVSACAVRFIVVV